jgi:hypothetical protein
MTQSLTSQININPFLAFLLLAAPERLSKSTNKSSGTAKTTPNHLKMSYHMLEEKSKCKKRYAEDSNLSIQNTQSHISSERRTPRRAKFWRVGIQLCKSFQEKAITLDGAGLCQIPPPPPFLTYQPQLNPLTHNCIQSPLFFQIVIDLYMLCPVLVLHRSFIVWMDFVLYYCRERSLKRRHYLEGLVQLKTWVLLQLFWHLMMLLI